MVPNTYWRFLGFKLVGMNDRGSLPANLWVFASIEAAGCDVKLVSNVGQRVLNIKLICVVFCLCMLVLHYFL